MTDTKKILISPFAAKTHISKRSCAKDYLFWPELVKMLMPKYYLIQVGVTGEENLNLNDTKFDLSLKELAKILDQCDLFISVDNFFPHFARTFNRNGIVIFTKSDPEIFGYKENINLLKDRKYLRKHQFNYWEEEPIDIHCHINPKEVLNEINKWFGV